MLVVAWRDNKFSYRIEDVYYKDDTVISCRIVNCPKGGKELSKADKKLENTMFCVALFTCDSCGTTFKFSS